MWHLTWNAKSEVGTPRHSQPQPASASSPFSFTNHVARGTTGPRKHDNRRDVGMGFRAHSPKMCVLFYYLYHLTCYSIQELRRRRGGGLPLVVFVFNDEEGFAPSLSCFSLISTTRRQFAPRRLRFQWRGGANPSSLYFSFIFNDKEGGNSFSFVFNDKEGFAPSSCFSFVFDDEAAVCPSSSYFSFVFNDKEGGSSSLFCFSFVFNDEEGFTVCPLLALFFLHFQWWGGVCPFLVFTGISTRGHE